MITWSPPSGDTIKYKAKWHNRWINNGHDVSQEWRGPYITGTEFRHYDKEAGHWVGRNLYVDANWVDTTARKEGDAMVVTIEAKNPRDGEFLNRETYHNITKDRWEMKSDLSFDKGETWVVGRYKMIATKLVD